MDIVKDQLRVKGSSLIYKNIQFDDVVIEQCCLVALRVWDKVEEPRKKSTLFTKIIQGSGETFTEFLQRLASAMSKTISDHATRQVLIETLAYKNANT